MDAVQRFRAERAALADAVAALLGPRADVAPADDPAQVASLASEFLAAHRAAEPHDWGLVRRAWRAADVTACADTLHRLSHHLGARPVWLVVPGRSPQAVSLASDVVLDNPLGFAALARGPHGPALQLLDPEVEAGLWLVRHSHHYPGDGGDGWELEVWGEPWLSAATRAPRGVG